MAEEETKKEEEIGSFYMGRRPPQPPRRLLPPGVLTVLALVALGGIIWYAYPRGAERYTNLDVPVVKADTAPIKEKPANPGGMEISHQDSTVFDPLQKSGNGAKVEKLAPAPEQPMDKNQAIKAEDQIKPIAASPNLPPKLDMQVKQTADGAEVIIPAAPAAKPPVMARMAAPPPAAVSAVPRTPTPAASLAPVKMAAAAPRPQPKLQLLPQSAAKPQAAAPVAKPVAKPVPAVKKEAPKKEAAQQKPKTEKVAAGGDYEVQLGSYRETADAKKDWPRLQKKYAAQLAGLKMRLVKADIPGKGIYYRMHAGTISKDRAHEICDALKATHGEGCFVEKR